MGLKVVEYHQYVDGSEFGGDDRDFEEQVLEVVEQIVTIKKTKVAPYEVGLAPPPPPFLTPKEKARYLNNGAGPQQETSASSPQTPRLSKGLNAKSKRAFSIINQAIGLEEEDQLFDYDEEVIEEEVIEEEYYDDDEYEEIIEEEFDEEEFEEIIEEVETNEEAEARRELEAEIAHIEQQIADAKKAKEQSVAEGGSEEETTKEKAERMAANSRLQACKQQKEQKDFKLRAAAKAKLLAEREKNWGKKGKKKQKDLAEIIASKAKKQQKLLTRYKQRVEEKKANPPKEKTPAVAPAVAPPPAAAAAVESAPAEEGKQLSMAEMLMKKAKQGAQGAPLGTPKPTEATQSRPANDFGDEDLRAEDFLPSDDSEEEEEEPELTPEEQYKKRLEWEKPTWTQAKLKTTTKGNKIKQGKYLSAPITMIPKKINEGLEDEEDDNTPSAGALMKGAKKMVMLPKAKKHQAGLKFTGNGARIRDGRKIEKPINSKALTKEEVKIWGADPEELKLTPRGLTARKGKILSDEITQATQKKKYQFEKPDWARTKPTHLLKATETGGHLKEGDDIAPKITSATEEKKYQFEKPAWLQAKLKETQEGKVVKEGAYLSAPIVNLDQKRMNINLSANPAFLKMTEQGEKLLEEGNLAGPITAAPSLAKRG